MQKKVFIGKYEFLYCHHFFSFVKKNWFMKVLIQSSQYFEIHAISLGTQGLIYDHLLERVLLYFGSLIGFLFFCPEMLGQLCCELCFMFFFFFQMISLSCLTLHITNYFLGLICDRKMAFVWSAPSKTAAHKIQIFLPKYRE